VIFFGVLCVIDALIALVLLFFFFWGISDGTVSSFNIGLWMAILGAVAALFGGGIALRAAGQRVFANILLAILAAPGVLYFLFFLLPIVTNPRWN
jgi:hypothetical protein